MATPDTTPDILPWLKTLPLAPEYRPTLSEFQDPISYIFKIEKEASQYGICKIIPPVPPFPKKTAITNLNSCLCKLNKTDPKTPTFTTRQQQIGWCPRKIRPNAPLHQTIVQKSVWQSGETYTIQQFEAKAKAFAKTRLKNASKNNGGPLAVETLFWKATADKPFSVEYANDMPGSGFGDLSSIRGGREAEVTIGQSEWNMMGVSRAKGSLLRFMPEEIPGVTSPMVYIAMLFSWFAWHVEDHDLHSLNYLHLGAPKTWYGVPRDAAVAFEEVIRVHGYGGQVNPLVTFATLGEKTTVMSPEVLIGAGIPCCRLIQNAGEFVVTFPRAYHSGFSHGFNCGEAANVATPEWLRFAKEAAVRRASINYPPMVSHFQLLYALALALCSSVPMSVTPEPRSSRLKDKKRGEGDITVKEIFVENVIQNNDLLHILLEKGSTCVLLPQNSSDISLSSTSCVRSQIKIKPRFSPGLCSPEEELETPNFSFSSDIMPDRRLRLRNLHSFQGKSVSAYQERRASSVKCFKYEKHDPCSEKENISQGDGPSDQGVLSCVTCGILGFACMAILHPSEEAVRNLSSGDCNYFSGQFDGNANNCNQNLRSGLAKRDENDGLDDILIKSSGHQVPAAHESVEAFFDKTEKNDISALDLLASAYGASSDSEDEAGQPEMAVCTDDIDIVDSSLACKENQVSRPRTPNFISLRVVQDGEAESSSVNFFSSSDPTSCSSHDAVSGNFNKNAQFGSIDSSVKNRNMLHLQSSDVDSSRMHIFCLEHAMEVEKQLRSIGGAHVMLLCNSDYPKVEAQAKLLAEEMGIDYPWKDIHFREATKEDQEKIRSALDDEEIIHGIDDWAVKLGVNLFYSANLSRSPLYSKQMPYNPVLYMAFGRNSLENSPEGSKVHGRFCKQKKIIVAGKWCGKTWMANQVHPYLANREAEEQVNIEKLEFQRVKDEQDVGQQKSPTRDFLLAAGKKRRKPFARGGNKKPKQTQWDATESDDSHSNPQEFGRDYQGVANKQGTPDAQCVSNKDKEGGPSTRLRRRPLKLLPSADIKEEKEPERQHRNKKRARKAVAVKEAKQDGIYKCDIENCIMSFDLKQELVLHKKNICIVKGCAKKFFSHKYLVQHRRVHMDDRPLECPWKGCKMTFKWAWAKTEHIRVHTGARPYVCKEAGCGQTFRFVSDFSRHKRKTGHSSKKNRE